MREKLRHQVADQVRFLATFIREPRATGSIVPSSIYLAKAMFKGINWSQTNTIVELGAGTGVFTRCISSYVASSDKIGIIFEKDEKLRKELQKRFPSLIYRENAINLLEDLEKINLTKVDTIISGLPFANFPPLFRSKIIRAVQKALRPGGQFITFQYSMQMKKQLLKAFQSVTISFVPFNIPPAFVYTCVKLP